MNQEQYDKLMAVIAQASNAADELRRKSEEKGLRHMAELGAVKQRECEEAFDIVMTLYAESNPETPWRCPVCGAKSMEVCATRHRLTQCLQRQQDAAVVDAEFVDPEMDSQAVS